MLQTSLLDTDLYKFTMMQAVLHQFPGARAEYRFEHRDREVDLRPYADEIRSHVADLCRLRLSEDELNYLGSLRFIKPDFVEFLRLFYLQERYIDIRSDGPELEIVIRGPWLHTILFEVPVLAIVNETCFRARYPHPDFAQGEERLAAKIRQVHERPSGESFRFSDFGSRRRFSREWQCRVVERLKNSLPLHFSGTSNVWLARKFDLMPIGTMAHEFLQAAQALGPRLVDSQKFALESWAREYRGDLGIALSDVVGLDAFLRDFDLYFCKLFDGMRHDSGDPYVWTEKVLAHYVRNRIDPQMKNLVYSDGLTMTSALAIHERFKGRARLSFGIGTHLTNDLGYPTLNIVIKMTRCNGQPVAKLSDSPGKSMCHDETYLAYLRQVFQVPPAT